MKTDVIRDVTFEQDKKKTLAGSAVSYFKPTMCLVGQMVFIKFGELYLVISCHYVSRDSHYPISMPQHLGPTRGTLS
jgi:hypothetical protein